MENALSAAPVDRLVRWRADKEKWFPVEVECPDGLYPHHDADGVKIFENTHFATRDECLERLRDDARIGVKWAGEEVIRCRLAVTNAYEKAGAAAAIFAAVSELE